MNSSRIALHPHQGPSTRSDPFIRRNRSTNCDDPLPKDQTCFALNHDGSQCHAQLIQHYHKLCPRHHKDLQKSKDEYKSKELESKSIEKGEQYKENEQGIQASIIIKEEIVRLRGQVQLRFFSRAADNLGHAQRILVLQAEIRDLVAKKQSLQRNLGPGSPKGETQLLERNPGWLIHNYVKANCHTYAQYILHRTRSILVRTHAHQ